MVVSCQGLLSEYHKHTCIPNHGNKAKLKAGKYYANMYIIIDAVILTSVSLPIAFKSINI